MRVGSDTPKGDVSAVLHGALFAVLAGTLAGQAAAAPLTLSTDDQTAYQIVVDPQATRAEKHAAEELARFLKQVTGANFPIVQTRRVEFDPSIIVGPGTAARRVAPDVDFEDLRPDGTVIETRSPHLVLAGDRPRGTLYAVYTFLEDVVGCRWWSPTASFIPRVPTLVVEERHDRYVPPLEYREPFWWPAFDPDWAVRNKCNGMQPELDEARGGHITYAAEFVHTFNLLVPPQEHFKDHPEWFSEIDGQRLGGNGERVQLCLTNENLKEFVAAKAVEWLKSHPDASIVSVSQNDWGGRCQCGPCRALETLEGSPSGPLLHFVNDVAAKVATVFPDAAVDTLAYQYTRKPPRYVRPLPNVMVRLCSIECNFAEPLADGPSNASFREDFQGWSRICNRLYVWDYTTNFVHYLLPHPNLRVLGPNVRFFVDHGVKGVFEQGAYHGPGAEFAELRSWVLAKLLWEPSRDPNQLIREFVTGYYGPAAPFIMEYIEALHDQVEASGSFLSIQASPAASYLTSDWITRAENLLSRAEEAVRGDPEYLSRVQVARLPLRYVWAIRWHELQTQAQRAGIPWTGPGDYAQNLAAFLDVARRIGMTHVGEGRTLETFQARVLGLPRHPAPPPPGCEALPTTDYVDLQDSSFTLYQEGSLATLTSDGLASDGVAVRMPGDTAEWATQQPLDVGGLDPQSDYTCYASVRCEKAGEEGEAFSAGLHDDAGGPSQAISVAARDVADDQYHTYRLATGKLGPRMFLWVAPPGNPQSVKAVWVDRFWLVKQK